MHLFDTYLHVIIIRALKYLYSRSQFTVCSENVLAVNSVPNKSITLRSAADFQTLRTGQSIFLSVLVPKNVIRKNEFVEKKRYCAILNATIVLHVHLNKLINCN